MVKTRYERRSSGLLPWLDMGHKETKAIAVRVFATMVAQCKHVECVLFGAAEQQDMYIFHCQRYRTLQDTDLGRTIICNNHVREPLWTLLFMDAMATECVVALDAVAVAPSGSRPSPHAPQTYVLDNTAKPWWPWRCALSWQAHTPRCCFQSTRMSVYSWT